jgi:hypothetical protein
MSNQGAVVDANCQKCNASNGGPCNKYLSVYNWCGDESSMQGSRKWMDVAIEGGVLTDCRHCSTSTTPQPAQSNSGAVVDVNCQKCRASNGGPCNKYLSVYNWCGDESSMQGSRKWMDVAREGGVLTDCRHCSTSTTPQTPSTTQQTPSTTQQTHPNQCRHDFKWTNNHGHTCAELATNSDAKSTWIDRQGLVAGHYCRIIANTPNAACPP